MDKYPNILIITCHDLGDYLGCYGTPISTPNLDALAEQGVLFENPLEATIGSVVGGWFYPFGRGDRGETSWLTQTDLTLYYTFQLGRNVGMSVGLTVLNLFDEDTATRQWTRRQAQNLEVTDEDFLTGFDYAEELAALGPTALDSRFGLWDTFQLPRNVRLTLKLEF